MGSDTIIVISLNPIFEGFLETRNFRCLNYWHNFSGVF